MSNYLRETNIINFINEEMGMGHKLETNNNDNLKEYIKKIIERNEEGESSFKLLSEKYLLLKDVKHNIIIGKYKFDRKN